MKKIIIFVVLAIACVGIARGTASAHVLKVDGDISAVLHINPDDNPVSGVPTQYILYFDDTSSHFSLADCDCMVSIKSNGQTVATRPLNDSSPLQSNNTFTFPKPAVYTMQVSGRPKAGGHAFQPFTLTYLQRVTAANGASTQPFPALLGVGLALGMGLIMLGAYQQNYAYNRKHKKGQ